MSAAPIPGSSVEWSQLKRLLMLQWPRLAEADLSSPPLSRTALSRLIEAKCGVSRYIVEHYLRLLDHRLLRILPA